MRDMPPSLDSALKDARKLESVEVAQQHLLLELGGQDSETSPQANAATGGMRDPMEVKVGELTAQVQKLTEELA